MSSQQQPMNIWDLLRSFDPNGPPGEGVDHHSAPPFTAGFFPFGGPGPDTADFAQGNPWGRRGGPWGRRAGRHGGRHGYYRDYTANGDGTPQETGQQGSNNERDQSFETMRAESTAAPDPAEVAPEDGDDYHHGPRGRPGRCGRGGGPFRHGGRHHGSHHGPHPHHPPPPFDFTSMMHAMGSHPIFQNLRNYMPQPQNANANAGADADADTDAFAPPVDTFNTPAAYVLHVAIPGARKEDVGVTWDAEARQLCIAGVVHRPGDEAFLATLQGGGERRVGLFERHVALPGDDEIETMDISARMEDGVLVVTAPKVPREEKEWTEIHKVDIE